MFTDLKNHMARVHYRYTVPREHRADFERIIRSFNPLLRSKNGVRIPRMRRITMDSYPYRNELYDVYVNDEERTIIALSLSSDIVARALD